VIDYHDSGWPERARELTGGVGVDAAVNTVRGGSTDTVLAVRDGGRMATITGDPPADDRGISVADVYVRPDAAQLAKLCAQLGDGRLNLSVGAALPLAEAATALQRASAGTSAGPMVLLV
jgi:NADPH:quinone reductase-like Zn-dependent oxidoreductase